MQKVEILGHTCSAVYKKLFFSEVEFSKQLQKQDRKSRRLSKKLIRKNIIPRLRQAKLEFNRANILVSLYKEKDFTFNKPIYQYLLDYRNIDRIEIYINGNRNPDNYKMNYKIRFFDEFNEELMYVVFSNNNEIYKYEDSLKGYKLLLAHININNIECDIFDETVFK